MARWLDGSMAGSTAPSMWLDGSMLTEDVFSLDALMPDSMPILMPSSICWLDAWLDAGSMQARCRLDRRCLEAGAQCRMPPHRAQRPPDPPAAKLQARHPSPVTCVISSSRLNVDGTLIMSYGEKGVKARGVIKRKILGGPPLAGEAARGRALSRLRLRPNERLSTPSGSTEILIVTPPV